MAEPAHGNLDDRKSVQGPSARAQPQLFASVVGTTSLGGRPRAGSVCPRTARPSDASAWRSPSAFPAAAWPARAPANRTSSGSVNSSTGGSPGSLKPLRLIPPYPALHRPPQQRNNLSSTLASLHQKILSARFAGQKILSFISDQFLGRGPT